MSQVNTELGYSSTATISLNQTAVRTLAGVPSGTISMNNLRGKSNQFAFAISSNQTNANLRTLAVNAGWNQSSKVVATINSGIYVSSNTTGTPGLTVNGSFPGGVELVNNGFIVGMGGYGGTGGIVATTAPGASAQGGGLALSVAIAVTLTNNGTIAGGGGGGGGSATYVYSYSEGKYTYTAYYCGGGGGGGRSGQTNSAGGAGGSQSPYGTGQSGFPGTSSASGSGGYSSAGAGSPTGGSGGNWGTGGNLGYYSSLYTYQRGSAGAGGGAISGNANITYLATGTRLGAIT
jgi:hypothetical protein